MKDLGQLCCCGVECDRHPTGTCEEFHRFNMKHHQQRVQHERTCAKESVAKAPGRAKGHKTPEADHELLHLLAMKAVWPRGASKLHFKTELHLDRAIEQCLDKALPRKKDHMKSLAQEAYEAFDCEVRGPIAASSPWEELPNDIKNAWNAALGRAFEVAGERGRLVWHCESCGHVEDIVNVGDGNYALGDMEPCVHLS
jgi:hypothetical protein